MAHNIYYIVDEKGVCGKVVGIGTCRHARFFDGESNFVFGISEEAHIFLVEGFHKTEKKTTKFQKKDCIPTIIGNDISNFCVLKKDSSS